MTRAIARACASLTLPVGCVLEGGYAPEALGLSVAATLQALSTEPTADRVSSPVADLAPIARGARRRLADLCRRSPPDRLAVADCRTLQGHGRISSY
jgi:hypothetical protein